MARSVSANAPSKTLRPHNGSKPLYEPLDFMLVRAPLLPLESYLALSDEASFEQTDKPATTTTLQDKSLAPRDPRVRRAIAVCSNTLLNSLERSSSASDDKKGLRGKLLRYLIRMSTRPTPFGLFAGVALGRWGDVTDLTLADAPPRTRTRLDMGWLLHQVLALESQPEVRRHLRLIANPTAFVRAGRVYLSERAPTGVDSPTSAISIRATSVVQRTLALSRQPVLYQELVTRLLETTPTATPAKIEKLINELWQQTFLFTDLRPPLTAHNPAQYVVERLADIPAAREIHDALESIIEAAARWDALPSQEGASAYSQLLARTESLSPPPAETTNRSTPGTPFEVDMAFTLDGQQINRQVGEEAARAAELLLRITPFPQGFSNLEAYRRAFESRYGRDREVSLLEMLDPDFGLGPAQNYGWSGAPGLHHAKIAQRSQTLVDLACTALRDQKQIVELDEETLTRLETCKLVPSTAPLSLDLYAFVAASSAAAIDEGEFQIIIGPNLGAQAAGRNLGRFADLLSPDAHSALERTARSEEMHAPHKIRAELVYLPGRFRSANVVIRPAVRNYEIALGVSSGVTSSNVIPLDELVVGIRGNRFYIRWPAVNAEIVACAGHMLNNLQAPSVIRFLAEAAHDGLAQLSIFDWGMASGFPFLPRVQAGRIVLRPAQWAIDTLTRARELPAERTDEFYDSLQRWRERWRVPRYVHLSSGDNRLLLNLENPQQAEELRGEVRRLRSAQGTIMLQEALPHLEKVWATGPGGRFLTEVVVSLALRRSAAQPAATDVAIPAETSQPESPRSSPSESETPSRIRLRPPGSEWLFVKLFCARNLEEDLIADQLRVFSEEAVSANLAQDWFFLRYSDPDPHIRLRFRGRPERLTRQLLPEICAWADALMEAQLCIRFSFDTYDRELERYGGPDGIEIAEAIFTADSRAVAQLLYLIHNRELLLERTALAVLTIDNLFAAIGVNEQARLRWYQDHVFSRQEVSTEYRQRKALLRTLLGNSHAPAEAGYDALKDVLTARRIALAPVVADLMALAKRDVQHYFAANFYGSIIHLHCNRLLGTDTSAERKAMGLLLRTREGLAQTTLK